MTAYMIDCRVQVEASSLSEAERRADELVPYLQPETAPPTLPEGITTVYVDDVREQTR